MAIQSGKRVDAQHVAVAAIYASSLHDLADQQGHADQVLEDLESIGTLLNEDAQMEAVFGSPLVDEAARSSMLEKAFRGKANDTLVDTLQVMNRKGRLSLLRALIEAYRQERDRRERRVEAVVTTAVPLTDANRERLRASLVRVAGEGVSSVRLIEEVEEGLLGGLVVRIGDRKLDYSVSRDVAQFGEALGERSSRELQSGKEYVVEEG